jgi:exosome complex component RRP42
MIANIQRQRILEYLSEGKRFDGRGLLDLRNPEVEVGISMNAEGSCSVKMGKTQVYAGVKMSVAEPYPDNPDEGSLSTTLELAPMADEDFDLGPPKIGAIEMARVVDRGIRESGFIDFKKLCIKEGEKSWQVCLDLYAINNDGNLFDAASLAALIALTSAKLPIFNEEKGKPEHEFSDKGLPLNLEALSFCLTFHKIGKNFVLDPTREEEEIADYRLSVSIGDNNGEPRITALQKGEKGAIGMEDLKKIIELVEQKHKELYPKLRKLVIKDE